MWSNSLPGKFTPYETANDTHWIRTWGAQGFSVRFTVDKINPLSLPWIDHSTSNMHYVVREVVESNNILVIE
jgi:hypothetical protein